jgi:hypothetical protein
MATPVLDTAVAWWRAKDYDESGSLADGSGNGHAAQLGSSSGADTNDPLYLEPDGYTDYANPGTQYLYLASSDQDYVSIPHSAANDLTGDLTLVARVARADWVNASNQYFFNKAANTGSQLSWALGVQANTGYLRFIWTYAGNNTIRALNSSAAPTVADGEWLWVKMQFDADTGGGNATATFFTGGSGTSPSWVQLGTVQSFGSATNIKSVATTVNAGFFSGTTSFAYKVSHLRLYSDATESTLVHGVDFTDRTNVTAASSTFTEDSSNAATVTINRSTTGHKSTVVDYPQFLLGTDDYLEVADHADLNFATTDSLTAMVLGRAYHGSQAGQWCDKLAAAEDEPGYRIRNQGSTLEVRSLVHDGTNIPVASNGTMTAGELAALALVRDATADTVAGYKNAVLGESVTDTTTGTQSNTAPLRFGATAFTTPSNVLDGVIYGMAVWRSALSTADLATAADELMGVLAADATQSTATVPATGTVGVATSITVQAKNALGANMTTGGDTVVVSITGANTATPTVTDNADGTYSASYTPTAAGADSVAIRLNGTAISGSPYTVTVAAAGGTTINMIGLATNPLAIVRI